MNNHIWNIQNIVLLNQKEPKLKILIDNFTRQLPKKMKYYERIFKELKLIVKNNFVDCFLQVIEILEITKNIPHIIRGSSGSSLTCYLLGITNIDPIKYNISLARFMHKYRTDLPDIDIDFPYNQREYIFQNIFKIWKNKVARISNHNMYHNKSALRQAIRDEGHRKFVPKFCSLNKIFNDKQKIENVKKKKDDLIGTFRCYSLHCGGIVIFDDEISDDMLVKDKQLKFNKDDVEKNGLIKIDILSNRGLAQLWDISKMSIIDYPNCDYKTINLLTKAENVGLTFAESPGMRKIFKDIKPKNIDDLATCLALIRPAASESKSKDSENVLIYDDDAIQYIQKLTGCNEGEADIYRKAFSKNKFEKKMEFISLIKNNPNKKKIIKNLESLHYYSFCKSHSYSYAQLVWCLAYHKANNPKEFWCSTINHCHSMYKKWVHYCEAKKAGLKLVLGKPPWKIQNNTLINKCYQKKLISNKIQEYKEYGYWTDPKFIEGMFFQKKENKYYFKGLIAAYRKYKKNKCNLTSVTIGYDNGKYVDLSINSNIKVFNKDVIEGWGYFSNHMIQVEDFKTINF